MARWGVAAACNAGGCFVVSEGTLRTQDTIPRMLGALQDLSPEAYAQMQAPACGFASVPAYALEDEDSEWWASDDAADVVDALHDALNEYGPRGFWFGAQEGDGACLGFWPIEAE